MKEQAKISVFGGKGARLVQLRKWGFRVPEFFIVSSASSGQEKPEELKKFLNRHSPSTFAVRSSATAEDSEDKSFAGQFQTFLNVRADVVPQKIHEVTAYAKKEHIRSYAGDIPLKMAVVVQRMIEPEISGVIFGADPVSGDTSLTVISATYGLGEGLVSGDLDADTFTYSNEKWSIAAALKTEKVVFDKTGTEKEAVEEKLREKACLDENQLEELRKLSDELTEKYGHPQDIEFCIENGIIWLLQSRPITALPQRHHNIWDNSNIIESYPGITSPLTFSFIIRMYKAVYEQLSAMLGVPQQKVEKNEAVFARMLGLLHGRVYYNLINWYRVLAMVPGFALNARFMEKMMGTGVSYELPEEDRESKWSRRRQFIFSLFKILKAYNGLKSETRRFQAYFDEVMQRYEAMDFEKMPPWEIKEKIVAYENVLLKRWRAPLVNDFFAMIFFGLFEKSLSKWYNGSHLAIHNDLLIGSQDIISARPVKLLGEIDELIRKNKEAKDLFKHKNDKIIKELTRAEFREIKLKIDQYLNDFGDRNVGELKLETITYRQQPSLLVNRIKNNLEHEIPLKRSTTEGNDRRKLAAKEVFENIKNPLKKWLLKVLLKRTRYLVSNRENLRYQRTRAFGMIRRMFLAMGTSLAQKNIIEAPRDIFYLKEQEIFEWIEAASVNVDLKKLIALRKEEYVHFEKEPPLAERIETTTLTYTELDVHLQKPSTGTEIKGLPCCAGVVEAKVRIIHSPEEAGSLNGEILVTASTDPGWITLFYGAAGILVERGSLLSHSAIVSREMNIPCIVSVKNLLSRLKTGDVIRMNGATGSIEILERDGREYAA